MRCCMLNNSNINANVSSSSLSSSLAHHDEEMKEQHHDDNDNDNDGARVFDSVNSSVYDHMHNMRALAAQHKLTGVTIDTSTHSLSTSPPRRHAQHTKHAHTRAADASLSTQHHDDDGGDDDDDSVTIDDVDDILAKWRQTNTKKK